MADAYDPVHEDEEAPLNEAVDNWIPEIKKPSKWTKKNFITVAVFLCVGVMVGAVASLLMQGGDESKKPLLQDAGGGGGGNSGGNGLSIDDMKFEKSFTLDAEVKIEEGSPLSQGYTPEFHWTFDEVNHKTYILYNDGDTTFQLYLSQESVKAKTQLGCFGADVSPSDFDTDVLTMPNIVSWEYQGVRQTSTGSGRHEVHAFRMMLPLEALGVSLPFIEAEFSVDTKEVETIQWDTMRAVVKDFRALDVNDIADARGWTCLTVPLDSIKNINWNSGSMEFKFKLFRPILEMQLKSHGIDLESMGIDLKDVDISQLLNTIQALQDAAGNLDDLDLGDLDLGVDLESLADVNWEDFGSP